MSLWTDTSLKTEKTRRHGRKRRQGKIWRRRRGAEGVNRKETNDAEGNDRDTPFSCVFQSQVGQTEEVWILPSSANKLL